MTEHEVVALMESAHSEDDWNDKCEKVQKEYGGYPRFWWQAIVMSGLMHRVKNSMVGTAAKGNLKAIMPPKQPGDFISIELEPPSPEEIEEMKRNQ